MPEDSTTQDRTLTAEQLIAAFALDAPVPIRHLYGLYGSRSTFHVWKLAGLDIRHVEGMGPTVIPSRFKVFLLRLRGDIVPKHLSRGVERPAQERAEDLSQQSAPALPAVHNREPSVTKKANERAGRVRK